MTPRPAPERDYEPRCPECGARPDEPHERDCPEREEPATQDESLF